MYDAVLFDNDGVLVELIEIDRIYDAVADTFAEFGVKPPSEDVERLVGVSPEELVRICRKHDLDAAEFWRRRDANVSRIQRQAVDAGEKSPYDDIDAVERIASSRPSAIVSNNQQETVDYIVESHGMSFFDACYGRQPTVESLRRKKPSPFYVERSLRELGTTDALYVGDSPTDVVAAERAGIDSAFVRREHRRDAELPTEPTYEVGSLHELERRLG